MHIAWNHARTPRVSRCTSKDLISHLFWKVRAEGKREERIQEDHEDRYVLA